MGRKRQCVRSYPDTRVKLRSRAMTPRWRRDGADQAPDKVDEGAVKIACAARARSTRRLPQQANHHTSHARAAGLRRLAGDRGVRRSGTGDRPQAGCRPPRPACPAACRESAWKWRARCSTPRNPGGTASMAAGQPACLPTAARLGPDGLRPCRRARCPCERTRSPSRSCRAAGPPRRSNRPSRRSRAHPA